MHILKCVRLDQRDQDLISNWEKLKLGVKDALESKHKKDYRSRGSMRSNSRPLGLTTKIRQICKKKKKGILKDMANC